MLGQQTSNQRKGAENMAGSSPNGGWTSPQNNSSSSFSRFQDIEVPLGGTTELNDDAKEKSLRRRSLLDERAARRRSLLSMTEDGDRRRSLNNNSNNNNANNAQGQNAGGSGTGSGSGLTSPNKLRPSGASSLLGVVDAHQSAPLPSLLKVSADSFEQWLKLATDNKINANNSWNFALIDYFHEMSLLREGDSINFQKASCTLDGCVKIYTSRVDSVATETTKLLGGLATSAKGREGGENGDQDDDQDEEENDKPAKKKHSSRSGNTLAKDFSQLTLEKFNLEFSVDPLFKKTSADFDEGGARGLLLNHLNVDAEGKIIFDAGDARDEGDDEDDDEDEDEDEEQDKDEADADSQKPKKNSKKSTEVEAAMIDIQRLRAKFLPSLNQIFEKDICPSLRDFQLTGSSDMDFSFLKRFQGDDDDDEISNQQDDDDDDFEIGANPGNAFDDEFGGGDDFNVYDDDAEAMEGVEGREGVDGVAHGEQGHAEAPLVVEDAFGDLDEQIAAQRAGPDLDLMMETDVIMGKTPTDMYQYFDAALMRNWAGPEHWKLRRTPKEKPAPVVVDGEAPVEEGEVPGPKKRGAKTALVIDFLSAEEVDEDDLFAPAEVSTLSMTSAQMSEMRKTKYVLPDDVHFSSKQLLKMFMKPSFIIKSKSKRPQPGYLQQPAEPESFNLTFPDEQFWASHTNNVDDGDVAALTDQLDQTQIYNDYVEDDDDDYGFQEQGFFGPGGADAVANKTLLGLGFGLESQGDGNDYASQLVSEPKRVKAAYISFSKTAKKVDVKKLKDNIWKEMTSQSLKRQPGSRDDGERKKSRKESEDERGGDKDAEARDEEDDDDDQDPSGDYVKKEQRFTEIIGGLSKMYPEQKLKDISVPFCFICLLHLANEKNLSIEGTDSLSELVIKQEG